MGNYNSTAQGCSSWAAAVMEHKDRMIAKTGMDPGTATVVNGRTKRLVSDYGQDGQALDILVHNSEAAD
jgi:hypothetical protein